jgi:hypothetical protein
MLRPLHFKVLHEDYNDPAYTYGCNTLVWTNIIWMQQQYERFDPVELSLILSIVYYYPIPVLLSFLIIYCEPSSFNQPFNEWVGSSVTDMTSMFEATL